MSVPVCNARARTVVVALAAACAATAWAFPALAAPLLLIDGDDTSVLVVDMGSRDRQGDIREASVYRGAIARGGQPRQIVGERHAFDCPTRRERVVAILTRRESEAPLRTPVDNPWKPVIWKSAMDYAATAVCLGIFDRDKVSAKPDVPSMLDSLEMVYQPGPYQPYKRPEPKKSNRSLLHPF
jgi:hypothetical protein